MIRVAKVSILICLFCTSSPSLIISSISYSCIFSPIVIIACLNSSELSTPSLSLSNTLNASTNSLNALALCSYCSLSLSLISSSSCLRPKLPTPVVSTRLIMSMTSASVGFRPSARTMVPNSETLTRPEVFLSKSSKISLTSALFKSMSITFCQERMVDSYVPLLSNCLIFQIQPIILEIICKIQSQTA